jgi:hypothetical protein
VRFDVAVMILLFVTSVVEVPVTDRRNDEPISIACAAIIAATAFRLRQVGRRTMAVEFSVGPNVWRIANVSTDPAVEPMAPS